MDVYVRLGGVPGVHHSAVDHLNGGLVIHSEGGAVTREVLVVSVVTFDVLAQDAIPVAVAYTGWGTGSVTIFTNCAIPQRHFAAHSRDRSEDAGDQTQELRRVGTRYSLHERAAGEVLARCHRTLPRAGVCSVFAPQF